MREAMGSKGNLVSGRAHEMNRGAVTGCQTAAERQRLQIDLQADSLGRVVRFEEPERLAGTAANIQNRGLGSQGGPMHKALQVIAGVALRSLEGELCAMVGQVVTQVGQPGVGVA